MAEYGETVESLESVNNDAFLTIQPPVGEEWEIFNIQHGGAAELYKYDGTNEVLIDTDSSGGAWASFKFFATNGNYMRVKNTSGAAAIMGYEGVRIK